MTVNSEAVTLAGSTDLRRPTRPGNTALPMPRLTATRTGSTALSTVEIKGLDTTLTMNGMPYAITCEDYTPTVTTTNNTGADALTCIYASFPGMPYAATTVTTYDRTNVSATLSDVTFGLMPSNFELRSVAVVASLKAGTTTVDLASATKSYSSPYPAGNATITDLPPLTGTTSSVLFPSATAIDTLTFNLVVKGFGPTPVPASIKCGFAATTVTTLTATSTTANTVSLSAAVDKTAAAGTVAFYEGATQVGSTTNVASGVATTTLTNVAAGAHSYTATFTPDRGLPLQDVDLGRRSGDGRPGGHRDDPECHLGGRQRGRPGGDGVARHRRHHRVLRGCDQGR